MLRKKIAPEIPLETALRAVKRAVAYAYVSGISLIVLGALSAIFTIRNPISASFAISVMVIINGIIEVRAAKQLRQANPRSPNRLALNQIVLGVEIALYSLWQMYALTPEVIQEVLARPMVATMLEIVEPELRQ